MGKAGTIFLKCLDGDRYRKFYNTLYVILILLIVCMYVHVCSSGKSQGIFKTGLIGKFALPPPPPPFPFFSIFYPCLLPLPSPPPTFPFSSTSSPILLIILLLSLPFLSSPSCPPPPSPPSSSHLLQISISRLSLTSLPNAFDRYLSQKASNVG